MFKVLMPRLDAGMKEGTIVEWLKKEGEPIRKGDPLVKIEGEKVVFDVEAQASGVLKEILVSRGMTAIVGETIAVIWEDNDTTDAGVKSLKASNKERIAATPAAKRIAKERDLDLSRIKGSGPDGIIQERDLPTESQTTNVETQSGIQHPKNYEIREIIPLTGMRKVIAERMSYSYRTSPHVSISMEVNMSRPLNSLHRMEERTGFRVPITALLANVTARALEDDPILNSILEDDQIKIIRDINIGIAVGLEEGLIVPVLHNADKKDISETGKLVKSLIEKAKARTLLADELKGATFTITNLGSFDVDTFTPIINPPQVAIMGIGRISKKPVASKAGISVAPLMILTLVFDHRVTDGARAAVFLRKIRQLLETFE